MRLVCGILIAVIGAGSFAFGQGGAPSVAAGGEAYTFRSVYASGKPLKLIHRFELSGESVDPRSGQPVAVATTVVMDMPLAFSGQGPLGPAEVTYSFSRVRMSVRAGTTEMSVDTDREETMTGPLAAACKITKALPPKRAALDAKGLARSDTKAPPAGQDPQARPRGGADEEATGIVSVVNFYFPSGPTRVGQKWTARRTVRASGKIGTVQEEMECTLAEVRATPKGRVAVIALSGAAGRNDPAQPLEMRLTGEVQYNLDRNQLECHRVEAVKTSKAPLGALSRLKYATEISLEPLPPQQGG